MIINKFWDRKGFREKKSKNPANGVKFRDFITDNGDDNDWTVKNNNSVRASQFFGTFLGSLVQTNNPKIPVEKVLSQKLKLMLHGTYRNDDF